MIADYGVDAPRPEVDLWLPEDAVAVHQISHDSAKREAGARVVHMGIQSTESVNRDRLNRRANRETTWNAVAGTTYHVVVDGQRNENAAWYYPEPKNAAAEIRGRIAFWRGVQVTD